MTGSIIFQRAGVQVEQTLFDNPVALQKLRSGEIDALIRMVSKPIDFFAKIPAKDDFHLVPIPFTKTFSDYYTLSEFTKAEYPTLISEGETITTLGVPAVLAVYNWPLQSDRARRVQTDGRADVRQLGEVPVAAPPSEVEGNQSRRNGAGLDALGTRRGASAVHARAAGTGCTGHARRPVGET